MSALPTTAGVSDRHSHAVMPSGADMPSGVAVPQFVLTSDGDLYGQDCAEHRELAHRIQACVAACAGISTAELEQGVVAEMRRVLAQVVPLLESRVSPAEATC